MTETSTPAAGRRRPLLVAGAAVVAALLVGAIALVATGGDDDPPRLDLSSGAPADLAAEGGAERVAETADVAADDVAGISMVAWATYVAGEELPDLGGSAPVYRLVADDDDLRAVAGHLGVGGEVTDVDGQQRAITDGDASVSRYGASWWYTSGRPYPGAEDVAPDTAVSCDADGACPEPAPLPEPERPADLPGQDEAEAIVRGIAEAAGLDLADARVTSYDNITTWSVNIELALDGTPVPGWSVYGTVMAGGAVLDAGGALGSIEQVGDYPLDTTRVAIDRLNQQSEGQGGAEPAVEPAPEPGTETDPAVQTDPGAGGGTTGSAGTDAAPPTDAATSDVAEPAPDDVSILPVDGGGEPVTVTLRSAELSYTLMGNADGTETYLVPAYLLDGTDDRGEQWLDVFAIAVRAEFLGA